MTKKIIATISILAFLLNLVWENAQAPLYQGYSSFWQHLPICTLGALGDVVIILVLYTLLALMHWNPAWIVNTSKSDLVWLMIFGVILAISIEWYALGTNRWQYTSAMPLVPLFKAGLLPVLQMVLLPAVVFYLSNKILICNVK
ncbi:MAG TPA: hypothetical protein VEA59_06305 [Patescibacteria group bacterium]|nr:hypothetical protein [Patescibacteria group bacterium]